MAKQNGGNSFWVRIVAGILAGLMVLSVAFTLIYCLAFN